MDQWLPHVADIERRVGQGVDDLHREPQEEGVRARRQQTTECGLGLIAELAACLNAALCGETQGCLAEKNRGGSGSSVRDDAGGMCLHKREQDVTKREGSQKRVGKQREELWGR
jgi:hypothetical protein